MCKFNDPYEASNQQHVVICIHNENQQMISAHQIEACLAQLQVLEKKLNAVIKLLENAG